MVRKRTAALLITLALAFGLVGPIGTSRILLEGDVLVPSGYRIDVAVRDLAGPTMVTFDPQGRMVVAESGYGGAGGPKVTRIEPDGSRTDLAPGFAFKVPLTAVAFHEDAMYAVDATTAYRIEDGSPRPIIEDLPGFGDHQANQIAFKDGRLYLAIGTVTNSGVVGYDNWVFGWLRDPQLQDRHEVPCKDIELRGQVFESQDPVRGDDAKARTSAYSAFNTTREAGAVVPGQTKCNGAVLSAGLDGSDLRLHAWGLRNPYGLAVGPDGELYASMHGFDARGSRPIENAWDCFYRIEEGAWYGFPDFACDVPVTDPRFRTQGKPQPEFLLAAYPTNAPPRPIAKFDAHAAANGFAFAPSNEWGKPTDVFLALFGDMTPATGTVTEPEGFKVVRVDTQTGEVLDFAANKIAGRASRYGGGGFEHPSDVAFGPDGAMYVADWGVADITGDGVKVHENSGVVWRVSRTEGTPGRSITAPERGGTEAGGLGTSTVLWGAFTLLLLGAAFALAWGPLKSYDLGRTAIAGALGGVVLGAAATLVGVLVFHLPWFAPARIMASMVMGRDAQANILEFEPVSLLVGVLVVVAVAVAWSLPFAWMLRNRVPWRIVAGAVAWALAGWSLLQFIVWPLFFPLISDKAFPPYWFAAAFALYGLTLGGLLLYDTLGRWTWGRRAAHPRAPE